MIITDIMSTDSGLGLGLFKTEITAQLTKDEGWVYTECGSEIELVNPCKEIKVYNTLYLKSVDIETGPTHTMTCYYIDRLGNELITDHYLTPEELEKYTEIGESMVNKRSGIHPMTKGKEMGYDIFGRVIELNTLNTLNALEKFKRENEMNTNWEFHSASDADINWKDIKDSLTYAEPLALVTREYKEYNGEDKYIVINKQLWDKAHTIGMLEDAPYITATVAKRVFCTEVNFSDWVDWAKAVKAASWENPLKSTLKVILPTV